MIGYLKGQVLEVSEDIALIDVNGVGYEVMASSHTLDDLLGIVGQQAILWIYTHVREDSLQLFAFHSKEEKSLFLSLLKVNGVGPKLALGILSGARVEQVRQMIEGGDAKALTQLPKVGKRTAEQIILTLKGKLVMIENRHPLRVQSHIEIVSALSNLGYKINLIEEFIGTLPPEIDFEEGIRRGLQTLSGNVGGRP